MLKKEIFRKIYFAAKNDYKLFSSTSQSVVFSKLFNRIDPIYFKDKVTKLFDLINYVEKTTVDIDNRKNKISPEIDLYKTKEIDFTFDNINEKITELHKKNFINARANSISVDYKDLNVCKFDDAQLEIYSYVNLKPEITSFKDLKKYEDEKKRIEKEIENDPNKKNLKFVRYYPTKDNKSKYYYIDYREMKIICRYNYITINFVEEIKHSLKFKERVWNLDITDSEGFDKLKKEAIYEYDLEKYGIKSTVTLDFSELLSSFNDKVLEIKKNDICIIPQRESNKNEFTNISEINIENITDNELKQYSQYELVKLIDSSYKRGQYKFIIDKVIHKNLLEPHIYEEVIIKKGYAHCLGSFEYKKYDLAYKLLSKLADNYKVHNAAEYIDIKTSAISNKRRELLLSKKNKKEVEGLLTFILNDYYEIFNYNNEFNYYPGINLLYIQKIFEGLGFDFKNVKSKIREQEIFNKSHSSILQDKKSPTNKVWADTTLLEFKLLMSPNPNEALRNLFLYYREENLPDDYSIKTVRQFRFYHYMIKTYSNNHKNNLLYKTLDELIEILDENNGFILPEVYMLEI